MNHEEYLLNEAYERNETPLNDPEPNVFYVCCNGDEIVFTTTDRAEATDEYKRVVDLNEIGDSDDYSVDLMECESEYFKPSQALKTFGYSEVLKSWSRN
jgi:hypothetical protein